ncbi:MULTISPECIES: hypothetical protein [unclassified Bradyrhizobium]|uniref:hypothetical protein n=1 Tax=unclassified Bradyrhizobium TaxID=2631580 RepID=UPI0028EC3DE3|nr:MULTISPECIES: hypothetical protein [unclassified Bradyrhizobium]
MDLNLSEKLLDILIDNSRRVLDAGFGIGWAESTFIEVVRLLRQEHELKQKFLSRVKDVLANTDSSRQSASLPPIELVEFVSHEIRWPELLSLAQLRIDNLSRADKNLAVGDISSRIKEAFADNWPDREFYRCYDGGGV